jgi:hypothetical protein
MPLTELRDRQVTAGHRRVAAVRRGQEHEAGKRLDAGLTGRNSVERTLMASIERRREQDARLADPIEQAKAILRKRYSPVVGAEVVDGPKGHFVVGRKLVTEKELLAMARAMAA